MIERIANVVYWAACGFAALCQALLILAASGADKPDPWGKDFIFFTACIALIWLAGWTVRYVLTGRGLVRL